MNERDDAVGLNARLFRAWERQGKRQKVPARRNDAGGTLVEYALVAALSAGAVWLSFWAVRVIGHLVDHMARKL